MSFISNDQFRQSADAFLECFFYEAKSLGFPVTDLVADHICFRVESLEQYNQYKIFLIEHADLLTEESVNGRLISTFRMHKPFRYEDKEISLLELPQPKAKSHYKLGFEHIEFVIKESFSSFAKKYNQFQFKISGNKNTNPEMSLDIKMGQIKFHYQPLDRVIEIEKSKIKNIIFDLDGTLVDSRETIEHVNSHVFSEVLKRKVTLKESTEKFQTEFSKLFSSFGISSDEQKHRVLTRWSEISQKFSYPLFKGVLGLLNLIKQKNINMHIWTARDQESSMYILNSLGIASYFKTMSFSNELESKPKISNLKFDWQGELSSSYLMIGDSITDMKASQNIKAIVAAALWDPCVSEDVLVSNGAELYFYQVDEFQKWILNQ
jgi:phosphoglycolate phosphatase-like HAD superfamily hydrolase/predicted metalloenzyme YecM